MECWSAGFAFLLRVAGYELRVIHCRVYCDILTRNPERETRDPYISILHHSSTPAAK